MNKEAGFSLVEVITSLFIIALIASAGSAVLFRTIDSRDNLERLTADMERVQIAHALLRDDLVQWAPRDFRARENIDQPSRFIGGDALEQGHLMSFVRDGWINPGQEAARSGLIVVRYFVEDDQLIRRVRLAPNSVIGTEEIEQILLRDIRRHRIEFRDGEFWVEQWRGLPGDLKGITRAVKLTLELQSGHEFEWLFLTPTGSQP